MKYTVNERFRIFYESLKIKNEEFADFIDATPNETSNWKRTTKIPLDRLKVILLRYPQLNARWLLTGEGSMIVEYEQTDRQYISQDNPQPPKHTRYCNDPACNARILELETQVNILISHIGSLNRREDPTEKNDSGGVEKTRRQYPGKTG